MTPPFSKAVDPIFLYVLGLLERIERGDTLAPQDERARIRGWLDQAEALLGHSVEWELARYAIVCWIDEVFIDAPWDGRDWWYENPMEVEVFNTREAHDQFYVKAKDATALPKRDALEVFYVCVVLGFRGLYNPVANSAPELFDLPPDLDTWFRQTALAIRSAPRPPITATGAVGAGAPPLDGQALLLTSSLASAVLSAFVVITAWLLYRT